MSDQTGRSLLELILALGLAAALTSLALPAWAALAAEHRLSATLNAFVASAQLARSQAVLERRTVSLCPRAAAGGCGDDFGQGWRVFTDLDGDGRLDPGDTELWTETGSGLTVSSNRRAYTWRPWGRRATNGTVVFCPAVAGPAGRAVIISPVGRPRASRVAADGRALPC